MVELGRHTIDVDRPSITHVADMFGLRPFWYSRPMSTRLIQRVGGLCDADRLATAGLRIDWSDSLPDQQIAATHTTKLISSIRQPIE